MAEFLKKKRQPYGFQGQTRAGSKSLTPDHFAGTWASGRVFRSNKSGTGWMPVSSGLPNAMDFSLSDLAVSGKNLFLGSIKGVFLSTDDGASWIAINSGLPEGTSVYCLAVSETDIFAGTEEGEVWRLPLS